MKNPANEWLLETFHDARKVVITPLADLLTHEKLNEQCRCDPHVQILSNGMVMISHNLMLEGWFIPND